MAISGLHVTMAAILIWAVLRAAQWLLPAHLIGYRFPLIASWLGTLVYVCLASWRTASGGTHRTGIDTVDAAASTWCSLRFLAGVAGM